jgi:dienelactone hydrolase
MMMRVENYKKTNSGECSDFIAAYNYLKAHKDCNGHIGVVGFVLADGLPT